MLVSSIFSRTFRSGVDERGGTEPSLLPVLVSELFRFFFLMVSKERSRFLISDSFFGKIYIFCRLFFLKFFNFSRTFRLGVDQRSGTKLSLLPMLVFWELFFRNIVQSRSIYASRVETNWNQMLVCIWTF